MLRVEEWAVVAARVVNDDGDEGCAGGGLPAVERAAQEVVPLGVVQRHTEQRNQVKTN